MKKQLEQKNKQLLDNKQIIDKLTEENEEISKQNKKKEKELNLMRLELNIKKNNDLNLNSIKNKEIEYTKKLKELNEKANYSEKLYKKNKELLNEKNNLESKISNLNKNKENLTKDLKKLEEQISIKKEILEKIKEDEKNMQMQNSNIIIKDNPQENQLIPQNIGNNKINQNIQNIGCIENMNPFPNKNFNNNDNNNINNINNNNINENINNNINNNNNFNLINNSFENEALETNQVSSQNQNNHNIPEKSNEPESISFYKFPTLIGLNNIGPTSYKNAVLQCFSQTKDLTNYFLKEKNYNKIKNTNLSKQNPNIIQLCPLYYDLLYFAGNKPYEFQGPPHF